MNPLASFKKWFRQSAEKVARRLYEGPDPPPRLFDEVEVFERLHPGASPEDWRFFVTTAIANAYRDGYQRGYEHRERAPTDAAYDEQRALEAEAARHEWSPWQGTPTSAEMRRAFEEQRGDPFAHLPPEERAAALAQIGQFTGTFKVVWDGQDDPTPWRKSADPEP
jgi:hypothetical protein